MRDRAFALSLDELNQKGRSVFCGISIPDIYNFLINEGNIDKKYIYIYREIPYNHDGQCLNAFNYLEAEHYYKKLKREKIISATDILIMTANTNSQIFKISASDINIASYDFESSFNDVEIYLYSHDFDWRLMAYFKDDNLYKQLLEYINKQSELIISNDWNDFS